MAHLDIVLALIGGAALGWGACALWTARWLDAVRRKQQAELYRILHQNDHLSPDGDGA